MQTLRSQLYYLSMLALLIALFYICYDSLTKTDFRVYFRNKKFYCTLGHVGSRGRKPKNLSLRMLIRCCVPDTMFSYSGRAKVLLLARSTVIKVLSKIKFKKQKRMVTQFVKSNAMYFTTYLNYFVTKSILKYSQST